MEIRLKHYGVKGMRWGVRRKRKSSGGSSEEHTTSRKLLGGKKVSQLSNSDISKINKRLKLEREFSKLNPKANAAGKRAVGKVLEQYGNMATAAVAGAAVTLTVGKLLDKA